MRTPWWCIAFAALATACSAFAAPTPPSHACSDPCLQAARSAYRDCASSATGAFLDTLDGCLERDHTCVDACREGRQDCRDATGVGAGLVACQVELIRAKQQCRDRFPIGSNRRAICIDRAEVAGFRCRAHTRRQFRRELRACRTTFTQCADACGPGEPPGGPQTCTSAAKAALEADLASCKTVRQASASGCINRDVTCVQTCADARDTCSAPTQAILDAVITSCNAQRNAAVTACQAANPGGG